MVAVAIVAGALRLSRLSQRPLHTDEAVHAVKFGMLLEDGDYEYDPNEYHGPTLNYATLLIAKLRGQSTYVGLDEYTLRLVPAFFGWVLVFLPLALRPLWDHRSIGLLCLFTAISPAFVYYSRYYIMEIMLVCFTFGMIVSIFRYLRSSKLGWMVCAGLCAGLMHATKETCVLAFACMALAGALTRWMPGPRPDSPPTVKPLHLGVAIAVAVVTSALFFSSFGTHQQGVLDSYQTYTTYLHRAGQGGANHHHGFFYYLDLLTWIELLEWPPWNEDLTVLLALLGCYWALRRRTAPSLVRFMAFYTLLMTLVYSFISYKTPWCMLGFLHGMLFLAAYAMSDWMRRDGGNWTRRVLWVVLLLFGVASPLAQAVCLNFVYQAEPGNPYVYAHTTRDIFYVEQRVRAAARAHPDGNDMYVQVICPGHDAWPLPWYLRDMNGIGYWSEVDMNAPVSDVFICQAEVVAQLVERLYERRPPGQRELYLPLFERTVQLRPGVELRAYIRKGLYDQLEP